MQQPMQNFKDISNPTTALDMALVLLAKAFTLNDTTPINKNQRSSSNPSNMPIAQPGMNIDQDRKMLMVEDNNVGSQYGLSVDLGIANLYGIGNVVIARVEGNDNGINGNQIRCYNCQGVDHYARNCIVKPKKRYAAYLQTQLHIAQKEEAGIQLNYKEFDFMAAANAYDKIEEVTTNCTLKDNLQQASTSGTQTDSAPVYDSDGSVEEAAKFVRDFKSLAKEADESLAKHKTLEFEIEHLLRIVVSQDIMSIVQSNSIVDTSNFQTELDRTKEKLEKCIIKKEKEYAVLWNNWYTKCEECKYDKISYDKTYNDMQQKIERLQAQLGDQKGKSKDTPCVLDTLDSLSQKLENKNVELEFQVLNYAKENAHIKTTYKNLFDSISVTRTQPKQ
ncbi:integrase, catalytic region, zinc finger, CCHC-type containing protein [Tanacetum coccineum]